MIFISNASIFEIKIITSFENKKKAVITDSFFKSDL